LFMVLSAACLLDVRVIPRRSTQITALIGLTKRYRDFERLGNSLNLFFSRTGDSV
jgi:hypothetical protein